MAAFPTIALPSGEEAMLDRSEGDRLVDVDRAAYLYAAVAIVVNEDNIVSPFDPDPAQ